MPLETSVNGDTTTYSRSIMDFQQAQSHAEGMGRNLMDWATGTAHLDWNSCGSHTCHDECSRDDCTQICDGSSICDGASVCMKEDCAVTACMSSCSSGSRHCLSMEAEEMMPAAAQHAYQEDITDGYEGAIQCPWILPGEPCDVLVDTRNALGRHIYEKHIDPQLTLRCPLESCSEVLPISRLPNHQAQQHQLDNYLCSWDSCADTYTTSDELFNHILASHGYLDCHYGGCEVSLKDPMDLQIHVAEDHLDADFSWPENSMFDLHFFSTTDVSGFENLENAIPHTEDYSGYQNGGGYCQILHHGPPGDSTPDYGPSGSAFNGNIAPPAGFSERTKHGSTYADDVESAWRNSGPLHQLQADLSKHDSALQAASAASCTGSSTAVSEHGSQEDGHTCRWIINSCTFSLCNWAFQTAEDLQEHLCNDHCKQKKKSRSAPRIEPICRWEGCGRDGEGLIDTHKLIRHVLTHSNRMYRKYNTSVIFNTDLHPDRAFMCNKCSKAFKTKGELDNHERMHMGDKPCKCEFCGKACSNETQLSKSICQPFRWPTP